MFRVTGFSHSVALGTSVAVAREFDTARQAYAFVLKSHGIVEHFIDGKWHTVTRSRLKKMIGESE